MRLSGNWETDMTWNSMGAENVLYIKTNMLKRAGERTKYFWVFVGDDRQVGSEVFGESGRMKEEWLNDNKEHEREETEFIKKEKQRK